MTTETLTSSIKSVDLSITGSVTHRPCTGNIPGKSPRLISHIRMEHIRYTRARSPADIMPNTGQKITESMFNGITGNCQIKIILQGNQLQEKNKIMYKSPMLRVTSGNYVTWVRASTMTSSGFSETIAI